MGIEVIEWPPIEEKLPKVELVADDGEPMESGWHVYCMLLLIEVASYHFRQRQDVFAAGNQFIYFNEEQARNRDFRGPDFYLVLGTHKEPLRPYWCVWEEGGKYPDLIIELLSPSTARTDRTVKKDVYEQTFRTPNFYCYDPATQTLQGWELVKSRYEPLAANEQGWLWCPQMEAWLGTWQGKYLKHDGLWLRFYGLDGCVLPIEGEAAQQQADSEKRRADVAQQQAEAAQQQAEAEKRRAEQVEAELARLKKHLVDREEQQKPK